MGEGAGGRTDPVVTVERVGASNRDDVVGLEVAEEHLSYVSPVAQMLEEGGEAIAAYAIRAGGEIVGFFRLDFDRHRVSQYAGGGSKCGLRGYLIGNGYQGRGHGQAAIPAIRDLLRKEHPEVPELVLTVNRRNAAGISSYLKAGLQNTGEIYHGGNSGPQHVFSLPLR